MIWTSEQQDAYYGAVAAEQQADCAALEERCEHLEAIVNATSSLLRVVVRDFESPCLKPIVGSVIERVNSVAAFLETGVKNAPNPDEH